MNFLSPSTYWRDPWLSMSAPGKSFESTSASGKWLIRRDEADIDDAWIQVLALVRTHPALVHAKVSTKQSTTYGGFPQHVICVYTRDWKDLDDVRRVRETLREAGFTERLQYKRDLDTMMRVEAFVYEE